MAYSELFKLIRQIKTLSQYAERPSGKNLVPVKLLSNGTVKSFSTEMFGLKSTSCGFEPSAVNDAKRKLRKKICQKLGFV